MVTKKGYDCTTRGVSLWPELQFAMPRGTHKERRTGGPFQGAEPRYTVGIMNVCPLPQCARRGPHVAFRRIPYGL